MPNIIPITIDADADWNVIDIVGSGLWVRASGATTRFTSVGAGATFIVGDKHLQLSQIQFNAMPLHAEVGLLTDSPILQVRTAHGSNGKLRVSSPVDSAENALTGTIENALPLTIHLTSAGAMRGREDSERLWASATLPSLSADVNATRNNEAGRDSAD